MIVISIMITCARARALERSLALTSCCDHVQIFFFKVVAHADTEQLF